MQEDKYRAWDSIEERMCNVRCLVWHSGVIANVEIFSNKPQEMFEYLYMCKPKEIMRFAGLKDSKGKEIYEGDFVRFYESSYDPNEAKEDQIEPETITVLIYWNEDGKCLAIDWDYGECDTTSVGWGYEWILNSGFDYHEIIGNIYENPELLKEVKNV